MNSATRSKVDVYPACAGIDLKEEGIKEDFTSLPRMRGDRPEQKSGNALLIEFTPHARGSTPIFDLVEKVMHVYPACAGIDPHAIYVTHAISCLPRMRGDRPDYCGGHPEGVRFTPHARGSTPQGHYAAEPVPVYPACAGIDL